MISFTFAELLRGFRQRASLKQTTLATDLDVHPNTISAWERGLYLPKDRELVLRLAENLTLRPAETDQLLRAAEFPLAYATPAPLTMRHQLRAPLADFVGRATEIQHLCAALQAALRDESCAIISGVRGMGGIGKTELAYRVAHELCAAFPDGQIVIELRGASTTPLTPEQALQTVIHALMPQVKLPEELAMLERLYRSILHQRRALILADDARDATQVRPLSPPPGCALLVTSRMRFTLPGMIAIDLEQLGADEAGAVLLRICPRLSAVEAQTLAHTCGYLPLALRVSGNILHNDPALPVVDYLAHLADERHRLAQLRDPADPQLDVEAALALSYVHLDGVAQCVFRQLGVLVADFSAALAIAVVEVEVGVDVEAALHRLLRWNLVMYDVPRGRWRLHDLLRALARRYLEAEGEQEAVMWRYARAAVQLAQETQAQYAVGGEEVLAALARFDAERPHIDAGRGWATEHAGTPEGDRLLVDDAVAARQIHMLRSDTRRQRIPQWECAHAAAQRLGDRSAEGQALNNLGIAYWELGDIQRAIPYCQQALMIARESGDRLTEGQALNNLGIAYAALGDSRRALPYYEQAIAGAQESGDRLTEGQALGNLGLAYVALGNFRRAIPYFEQRLTITCTIGDWRNEGMTLSSLGGVYRELGEMGRAIAYFEQHLVIARTIGDRRGESIALNHLGQVYSDLGEVGRAIECCTIALSIIRAIGDRLLEGYALSNLACAHALRGDVSHATTTFEQALALIQEAGDVEGVAESQWKFGLALAQRGEQERALSLLRAAVAYEQEIGHAKAAGRAALLAHLEMGEDLPVEALPPDRQRAVGNDAATADSAEGAADVATG